ncbi:MAG: hypothetical protein Q8Q26_16830, partial [Pseudorhodobacter sp.]|nr:hypothetical protein [Pseudorhodobacter sp.]
APRTPGATWDDLMTSGRACRNIRGTFGPPQVSNTISWEPGLRGISLVSEFFDFVEGELSKYPEHVREIAISEAESLVSMFASSIQRRAVEKNRILRGDGISFPQPLDSGRWEGSDPTAIHLRAQGLLQSYCDLNLREGGNYVIERMMTETLSFLKADGTMKKDGIKGLVTGKKLITFDTSLTVQPGDKFLRELPSGLVEDYIVEDPGFQVGVGDAIKPHFQATVRRSDAPAARPRKIITHIQGANSRVNIDSVDRSQNLVILTSGDEIFQQLREKVMGASLNEKKQAEIMAAIGEMARAKDTPTFKGKYQAFMTAAADHASVFGTLLAALAMFL